jgi:mRNA interferase MazF
MIEYSFGDIILVPFPFTDQTTVKKRPAVIVSSATYNRQRPDVIIMAVTSQRPSAGSFGEVRLGQWRRSGLVKPSVVKPIFTTIEKGLVQKRLGRLADTDRSSLQAILEDLLGE